MRRWGRVLAGTAVLQALAMTPVRAMADDVRPTPDSVPAEAASAHASPARDPSAETSSAGPSPLAAGQAADAAEVAGAPGLTGVAGAAAVAPAQPAETGVADRLADTLADTFVPLSPLLDADAMAERRKAREAVRHQLQAPVRALVQSEVADRTRDPRTEAVAERVLDRVLQLRRTAPLRWPASLREDRFRRAFSAPDPRAACAAPLEPGPVDLAFIRQSIDAMFSTAVPLVSPQPELSLRLVDAVIEAMHQPHRVDPPFPEQAVSALGVGLGTGGDEGNRRALCLVSFWWAQRALAKPFAARQADIDAYVHASVQGGARSWRPLPDGLGEGAAGWLLGAAPLRVNRP